LILLSSFSAPASPMCISGISGYGLWPFSGIDVISSLVYTE
jgi:hypothetical protein